MYMVCARCGAVIPENYKHYEITANCVKDNNIKFVKHYYVHGDCWNRILLTPFISVEERARFQEELHNGKF